MAQEAKKNGGGSDGAAVKYQGSHIGTLLMFTLISAAMAAAVAYTVATVTPSTFVVPPTN